VDYPRAGAHYPRSTGEFLAWFGTDEDCLDYLEWLRWPASSDSTRTGHRPPVEVLRCPGAANHHDPVMTSYLPPSTPRAVAAVENLKAHYPPSPVGDGVGHGCQIRVMQPGRLPDRSAYLQLEELVFTKPAARAATKSASVTCTGASWRLCRAAHPLARRGRRC